MRRTAVVGDQHVSKSIDDQQLPKSRPTSQAEGAWRADLLHQSLDLALLLRRAREADGHIIEFRQQFPREIEVVFLVPLPHGQEWYQAQLAPPGLGSFSTKGYNKAKVTVRRPELMKPTGEWNVMEISCRGSELALWFNGESLSSLPDCVVFEGKIGLQAEFAPIEFRSVKFRALKP